MNDDKVLKFHPKSYAAEAKMALSDNPDVVFEEVIKIKIKTDDFDFWLKFSSEWGGVLYLMDEKNAKQLEENQISEQEYEFSRRSFRLGLITLSTFYDQLKAWADSKTEDYIFSMNTLDCFYMPVYLNDYVQFNKIAQEQCEVYTQAILYVLGGQGDLKARVEAVENLVQEYIENIHLYSGGTA
jgi:hypothetical protein